MTGYRNARYAESLAEFGTPRFLRRSRGWLLEREIPGTGRRDAMGCYPLFACYDWRQLDVDIGDLADDLVSLSIVTDPFGDFDVDDLRQCFDVLLPFKEHYIVDLALPLHTCVSRRHRLRAHKALRVLDVEQCPNPSEFLNEWTDLYAALIQRHDITGIPAFSRNSFETQLRVPGLVMFRAHKDERTIAMSLWYTQGDVGYYHLAAANEEGYRSRASYALVCTAIEHFANRGLQCLDLGAGAGLEADVTDGLSSFKQGWSNGTRLVYFGGRVLDPLSYRALTGSSEGSAERYFPAYRKGEFA